MPQSRYPVQRSGNWPSAIGNWDWNDWFSRWGFPSFFERTLSTGAHAPVDVCERENEFIIRMACAGCRPEDIDVTVENDTVRIRGKFPEHFEMGASGSEAMPGQSGQQPSGQPMQRQAMSGQQETGRGETCLVRELPSGRFERDITLPMAVDAPGAQANFENGLLFLTVPKARAAQGHRIQISQGGQQSASVSTHQGTSGSSR